MVYCIFAPLMKLEFGDGNEVLLESQTSQDVPHSKVIHVHLSPFLSCQEYIFLDPYGTSRHQPWPNKNSTYCRPSDVQIHLSYILRPEHVSLPGTSLFNYYHIFFHVWFNLIPKKSCYVFLQSFLEASPLIQCVTYPFIFFKIGPEFTCMSLICATNQKRLAALSRPEHSRRGSRDHSCIVIGFMLQ